MTAVEILKSAYLFFERYAPALSMADWKVAIELDTADGLVRRQPPGAKPSVRYLALSFADPAQRRIKIIINSEVDWGVGEDLEFAVLHEMLHPIMDRAGLETIASVLRDEQGLLSHLMDGALETLIDEMVSSIVTTWYTALDLGRTLEKKRGKK